MCILSLHSESHLPKFEFQPSSRILAIYAALPCSLRSARDGSSFASGCVVILLSLGVIASARATFVTAYLYEMHVSGTFGTTIDPNLSNLPDSTYRFPQMRGGSFDGTFVYDSMASLDESFEGRFPYVAVNINLVDNTGAIANTITSSPNNFYVTDNTLQLTFGPSAGIINSIFFSMDILAETFHLHPLNCRTGGESIISGLCRRRPAK